MWCEQLAGMGIVMLISTLRTGKHCKNIVYDGKIL
jgi:hypothetical protein